MDKFKLRKFFDDWSRGYFTIVYGFFCKNYCDKINNKKIYYRLDSEIGKKMFLYGKFEEKEFASVGKFIKSDSIILDIGANIGITSLFFSKVASDGLIFSFEPAKDTFSILLKNVKNNNNVVPLNFGFSDVNSIETFYESSDNAYSSFKDTKRKKVINKVKALQLNLDGFFELLNLEKINFIKIDVEGLEFNVLKGGSNVIDKYRPIIFCEIYNGLNSNLKSIETIDFLMNKNYKPLVFKNDKFVDYEKHDDNFYNYLFVPSEHFEEIFSSINL